MNIHKEAIIAEASAFSEYRDLTDEAFRRIVGLAKRLPDGDPETMNSVLECIRMFYTGDCATFDPKYPWMVRISTAEWNAMIICFLANAVGGTVYEGMGYTA